MNPDRLYQILVDIFGEPYKTKNNQFRVNCFSPNCDDETGNLEISLEKSVCHCWKCGYKGTLRQMLKDYLGWLPNVDEYISVEDLRHTTSSELFKTEEKRAIEFKGLPNEYIFLGSNDLSYVGKKALKYVLTRMTMDEVIKYRVGYCGIGDYKWRIIIPSFENNRANYFIARAFMGNIEKYHNPSVEDCGVGKASVVFNIDGAKSTGRAVICLVPETIILTDKGEKKIIDIEVGDLVLTHTGNFKRVEKIFKSNYKGSIKKIQLKQFSQPILVTKEHPLYGVKKQECIKKWRSKYCSSDCRRRTAGCHKLDKLWIKADSLNADDMLCFSRKCINKKYDIFKKIKFRTLKSWNAININTSIIRSTVFWTVVGLFLGDGTASPQGNSFCFDIKSCEKQRKILKRFAHLAGIKYHEKRKGTVLLVYQLNQALGELFKATFYDNSGVKTFPYEFEINLDAKYLKEVINGLYLSDGYAHQECPRIYNTAAPMLRSMQRIMLRLGGMVHLYETRPSVSNYMFGKIKAKKPSKPLYVLSGQGLYFLDDKKYNKNAHRCFSWMDDEYIYTRIKKIENVNYDGDVYNLKISDDNSYCSHLFTFHNCEGVFDAIRVGEDGVAIFGTNISEQQLWKLLPVVRDYYIMLDRDAIDSAIKLANVIQHFNLSVRVVIPPKGDPGDWSRESIRKWILDAKLFSFSEGISLSTM